MYFCGAQNFSADNKGLYCSQLTLQCCAVFTVFHAITRGYSSERYPPFLSDRIVHIGRGLSGRLQLTNDGMSDSQK